MNKAWRWFLPGHLMALPMLLVGLALSLVYRCHSYRINCGCLEAIGGTFERDGQTVTRIWGRPGAQTFGGFIIYADEHQRSRVDLRVHERVHIVQCFVFALGGLAVVLVAFALLGWPAWLGLALGGPVGSVMFAVSYGACFAWFYAAQGFRDWRTAYRRNPFEVQAYRIGDAANGWGERPAVAISWSA